MPAGVNPNDLPAAPPGRQGWPWTGPEIEQSQPPPPAAVWPSLTIVTPSYNQAPYLEETIRSVLLQGYPKLEYIIIDGGSTDESVDIIRKYEPWLDYWVSEADRGQSHAINKGFGRAHGDFLAWLNSDDTYLPGALACVAAGAAGYTDVALIYGQALCMDKDSVLAGEVLALPYDYPTLLSQSNFVPQASAFIRHQDFLAAGGLNEDLHYCMDYDLWLRLHGLGRAVFLPRLLSGMRMYPESKTGAGNRRMFAEAGQIAERHGGQGLPSGFQHWLLASRLPIAFEAFRQGQVDVGRDELGYVMRSVPAWQASVEPLIQAIVQRAWQQGPGLADDDGPVLAFAELVCSHLPVEVADQPALRRSVLARIRQGLALRNQQLGRCSAARHDTLRAFQNDPGLGKQKWLWGSLIRSYLPPALRRSRHDVRLAGSSLRYRLLASLPITAGAPAPNQLLDTCGLAAITGLVDAWDVVEPSAKERWTADLRAAQDASTGLFGDPLRLSANPNDAAASQTYGGWLTTYFALAALDRLGAQPRHPLLFAAALKSTEAVRQWLVSLDWVAPEWSTSLDWSHPWLSNCAQVMFLLSFLFRDNNRTGPAASDFAAQAIFDWLDERQDPTNGFWGMSRGKYRIVNTVVAGHFVPIYMCFGRPLKHSARLIDTAIAMQAVNGLVAPNGVVSPCATQAAVDLLVKLSLLTDYRASAIKVALEQAFWAVAGKLEAQISLLRNPNPVVRPAGQWLAHSPVAAIWFYMLTLGLISQRYPGDFPEDVPWQLPPAPTVGWHQPNMRLAATEKA